MSTATAISVVNGLMPTLPGHIDEAAEYEKILKLRDEIFAGTHPRLTVPAHAIRKVSPLSSTQLASAPRTNVPPPFSILPQQSQLPGLSLNHEAPTSVRPPQPPTESLPAPQPKPTASGIDPVLLTKSEDLVRAETQIQRQRLEKALRDQFEQKRLDARKKPALGEAKPDFDVTAVLTKALDVVKPDAPAKVSSPKHNASLSESYDENSLYSSRAPDSTPEAGELEGATAAVNHVPFTENDGANDIAEVQRRVSVNAPIAVLPQHSGSRSNPFHPVPSAAHTYPDSNNRSHPEAVDLTMGDGEDDDDEEEGEYSPPEAMDQFATPQDSNTLVLDPRSRPLRRYSELDDPGRRPGSANGDRARMNNRGRTGRAHRGRDDSPDASSQNMPPKKKRKLERKAEKRRRLGRGSPDVKDEPVSPPPFHDVQPLGSGKLRPAVDERPIVLDDTPTRAIRYVPAPDRYMDSPLQPPVRHVAPAMPPSEPRHVSQTMMRPPEQDLRRVASMHSLRDAQPREYIEQMYDPMARARATPLARVNSPKIDARLVQESPTTYARSATQSMGPARTPGPPIYREVYADPEPQVRYMPEPMPPPVVERIVVDAEGRKYREIIEPRASVAPRPVSQYLDREQSYYGGYERPRAGSVMVEPPAEARYMQDMAPPRSVRPVADVGFAHHEPYDPRTAGRSSSIAPLEYTPRQTVYLEDRGEFREPIRMGSVRPVPSPYDDRDARQVVARNLNGRPPVREGSVYVDDRSQVRREYVPTEVPQYRIVDPPAPRYVDAQGREIIFDGAQSGMQRQVSRYRE